VKKKYFLLLIISLFVLILLFSCEHAHKPREQEYLNMGYQLSSEEVEKIQDGDIIMRQGYGIVSSIILETLKEDIPLSHIGIIVENSEGEYDVIHSVSRMISDYDGIQIDNLKKFISHSRNNSVLITRYKNDDGSKASGREISNRAKYYLDKKVPFDHSFDFQDTTSFFCSELVWRILIDKFDDDIYESYSKGSLRDRLKFEPFYDLNRFEIIVNHHNN